jgi:hypothetical protein
VPTFINFRAGTPFGWLWLLTGVRLTILASEQIFQNAHDDLLLERCGRRSRENAVSSKASAHYGEES